MSRYRLYPAPEQEAVLREHCAHARYIWNLAVEQQAWWTLGRAVPPGFAAQCQQLSEARAASGWLAAGSVIVQQQALRDFDRAMKNFFAGTHGKPGWRKRGRNEGFRIVAVKPGDVRRLNRRWGQVKVPKTGWVRFRWSRVVPESKSYRITLDRGVAVTLALSDGTTWQAPAPLDFKRQARRLARCTRGSNRRQQARLRLAKIRARDADRRKDWAEKASTTIASQYDVIRIEDLKIANMTRSAAGTLDEDGVNVAAKAGLNRSILAQGWGLFARRLDDKAAGRVEKIPPALTSQTCSQCKRRDREARESQAVFRCRACGYCGNADVNAARNIAAGHAVTARGGDRVAGPVKREPQEDLLLAS